MSQVWRFVQRLHRLADERQRLVDITAAFRHAAARLHRQIGERLADAGGGQRCVRSFVEVDLQRAAALHGRPCVAADNCNSLRDLHDVRDSGHGFCLRGIEARDLAAKHRAARDHRVEHPRQLHIDAERGPAGDLGGRVDARNRFANELELRRIFERDGRRHRQLCCRLGEAAVGQARICGGVDHDPVFRAALRRVDAPARGRSLHQHVAYCCARSAQRIVGRADGHAAERALQRAAIERRVDRRELGLDARPIAVELFGEQLRERRFGSLPIVRLVNGERHDLVRTDADEGARGDCATTRRPELCAE
jgi:hypothetical protein